MSNLNPSKKLANAIRAEIIKRMSLSFNTHLVAEHAISTHTTVAIVIFSLYTK